jgi:hypothetical protein
MYLRRYNLPFRDLLDSTLFAVLILWSPLKLFLDGGGLVKISCSPPNTIGIFRYGQRSVIRVANTLASLPCSLGRKVSLSAITKDFSSWCNFSSDSTPSTKINNWVSDCRLIPNEQLYKRFSLSCICDISQFWLSCLGPLVLLLPKFQIIWLFNLSILSVPNEGSSRNASCALNLRFYFSYIETRTSYISVRW